MNRIKEARERRKISQKALAKKLGVTQQAISYYEQNKRTPDEKTFRELQNVLDVPEQYLKGLTIDPDGWDLWEKNTGFSKQQIQKEINRLKSVNRITEATNLQNQIGLAVQYLDGRGKTDYNALEKARCELNHLLDTIHNEYYLDPEKVKRQSKRLGNDYLITKKNYDGSMYYNDMDKDVYNTIATIIEKARTELAEYMNKHEF